MNIAFVKRLAALQLRKSIDASVEKRPRRGAKPPGGLGRHARFAHDLIREAVEIARATQKPRLLARAYVWRGLTLCNAFCDDPGLGAKCYDAAAALLKTESQDWIWEDLRILKRKAHREGGVGAAKSAARGEKTFHLTEKKCAEHPGRERAA